MKLSTPMRHLLSEFKDGREYVITQTERNTAVALVKRGYLNYDQSTGKFTLIEKQDRSKYAE